MNETAAIHPRLNTRAGGISCDGERLAENAFLIIYALLIIRKFLEASTVYILWPEQLHFFVRVAGVACAYARLSFFRSKRRVPAFLAALTMGSLVVASHYNGYSELVDLAILIAGMQGIPGQKIVRTFFTAVFALLGITVCLAIQGVIVNLRYLQADGSVRNSMGIIYPTDFSAYFFFLSLAWIYLREKRITYYELLLIGGLSSIAVFVAQARLSAICQFLIMIVFLLVKLSERNSQGRLAIFCRSAARLSVLAFPVCAALIIFLSLSYPGPNNLLVPLDDMLSNRLLFSRKGFLQYGLRLLGQNIPMNGNGASTLTVVLTSFWDYFFLDCALVSIPLRYGLLVSLMLLGCFLYLTIRACRSGRHDLAFILALIAVNGMIEHHMLEINYNPFIMLFFARLSSPRKEAQLTTAQSNVRKDTRQNVRQRRRRLAVAAFLLTYAAISTVMLACDINNIPLARWDISAGGDMVSSPLKSDFDYVQYFYAPTRTNGLEIHIRTNGPKPLADLVVLVGDAETGETVGIETIPFNQIPSSNAYVTVCFSGYKLSEGHEYFFSVARGEDRQVGSISDYQLYIAPASSPYVVGFSNRGETIEGKCADFHILRKFAGNGLVAWIFLTVISLLIALYCFRRLCRDHRAALLTMAFYVAFTVIFIGVYAHFVDV